ncbi:unnamed protein product [Phaeothamnion confervicola]
MLLCIPVIYCCVAKMACCCRTLKRSHPKDSRLKWLFLLASLLTVVAAALTITGFVYADEALVQASDNIGQVESVMTQAADLVESAVTSLTATVDAFSTFTADATTCIDQNEYDVTLLNDTLVAAVQNYLTEINTELTTNSVEEEVRDLANEAASIQQSIDDTTTAREVVVYGVFAVNLFVVLVFCFLGWVNLFAPETSSPRLSCWSKWIGCLASPVAIIVIFASWIIVAGSFMCSSVVGDFCVNPDQNTLALVGDNKLVVYYITCRGQPQVLPIIVYEIRVAMAKILEAIGAALEAALKPGSCMDNADALAPLSNSLYALWNTMTTVQEAASCEPVNTLYTDITASTVCSQLSKSMEYMLAGSMLLAIALMIVMILYRIIVEQRSHVALLAKEREELEENESEDNMDHELLHGKGDGKVAPVDGAWDTEDSAPVASAGTVPTRPY